MPNSAYVKYEGTITKSIRPLQLHRTASTGTARRQRGSRVGGSRRLPGRSRQLKIADLFETRSTSQRQCRRHGDDQSQWRSQVPGAIGAVLEVAESEAAAIARRRRPLPSQSESRGEGRGAQLGQNTHVDVYVGTTTRAPGLGAARSNLRTGAAVRRASKSSRSKLTGVNEEQRSRPPKTPAVGDSSSSCASIDRMLGLLNGEGGAEGFRELFERSRLNEGSPLNAEPASVSVLLLFVSSR